MGIFASKHARGGPEPALSLDLVASRPKLEPHEVAALRLTSHGTYAALAAHVYGAGDPGSAIQVPLPDGWEVLLQCSQLHLDREGYFAVAYIHRRARHCVVAQRGTSEVLGLRAGVWMYFEQPTIQFFLAEQFSRAVRHTLATVASSSRGGGEWFLTYTGHSLGAVIATCRAVEEGTLAITFESPGGKAFITKTLETAVDVEARAVNYLRAPNPINTLKPHCGYCIVIPTQQVRLPSGTLFLTPSLPPPPREEDETEEREVLRGGVVQSRRGAGKKTFTAAKPATLPTKNSNSGTSGGIGGGGHAAPLSSAPAVAAVKPAKALASSSPAVHPPAKALMTSSGVEGRASSSGGEVASSSAAAGSGSDSGDAAGAFSPAKSGAVPSISGGGGGKAPSRWRLPSFRPQQYLRGYVFSGVGMGIPELQQYVSKVEPMIREMLEHTQQVHSIHSMRVHFDREDEPGDEEVVVRWPEHLLQFMEFYNTFRALEDPENQETHLREAYRGMMRRLYSTEPRRRDCIPVRYVDRMSLLVVRLWWSTDASQRKLWPLSFLDHKTLNMIQIKDGYLCCYVLSALQAKQYLVRLVGSADMSALIDQWRKESVSIGPLPGQSRL